MGANQKKNVYSLRIPPQSGHVITWETVNDPNWDFWKQYHTYIVSMVYDNWDFALNKTTCIVKVQDFNSSLVLHFYHHIAQTSNSFAMLLICYIIITIWLSMVVVMHAKPVWAVV